MRCTSGSGSCRAGGRGSSLSVSTWPRGSPYDHATDVRSRAEAVRAARALALGLGLGAILLLLARRRARS